MKFSPMKINSKKLIDKKIKWRVDMNSTKSMLRVFILKLLILFFTASSLQATWSSVIDITSPTLNSVGALIVADGSQNLYAIWSDWDGVKFSLFASVLPFGGSWSTPVEISDTNDDVREPKVVVSSAGDAVVIWLTPDTSHFVVKASNFTFGGSWSSAVILSDTNLDAFEPNLILNDTEAVASWTLFDGSNFYVQSATFGF